MIYLSSTTKIPDRYKWNEFGVMFSANHAIGGLDVALQDGAKWMMDNNAFNDNFKPDKWLESLLKYRNHAGTCLGIPCPDVVGDALETIRLFHRYYTIVSDIGFPVAFVSQNGVTPGVTPWEYFGTLFIGGDDDHKLGPETGLMIAEAKKRGKLVHVGRVNSAKRIKQFWMADSVDGTILSIMRKARNGDAVDDTLQRFDEKCQSISDAVQWCRNKKSGRLGVDNQYIMEYAI